MARREKWKIRWNMPEIRWFFGYPAVLLLMAAVTVLILGIFYRRGWFR